MHAFRSLLRSQSGVTLAEMIVVIGIMTLALTMVGSPLFASLRRDEQWRADITATTTLQRVGNWVAKDTINAESVSVADGAPAADNLTASWNDLGGAPHSAGYALNGVNLIRTYDGASQVIGRNVTLVEFTRVANILTFTVGVAGASGSIDVKTSSHLLRSLQ